LKGRASTRASASDAHKSRRLSGCFEGYANLPLCTPDATTANGGRLFDDH
jgi:hypothetical protein